MLNAVISIFVIVLTIKMKAAKVAFSKFLTYRIGLE